MPGSARVEIGGDGCQRVEAAVFDDQPPAFLVDHPVVAAAEQDQVRELGLAAVRPMLEVVPVNALISDGT